MITEAVRRRPLADYTDRFAALSTATDGALSIRELPFVSQVNLRADPKEADLMQRLATAIGFALPIVPNSVTSGEDRRALWLAPDEWLVVGPDGQQVAIDQELRVVLSEARGSVVDVSANRTVIEIRGSKVRDLLAHGVSIDLDARSFSPGQCVQTLLSKAQVIIECRDQSGLILYIRASFATYAAEWLLDAAAE